MTYDTSQFGIIQAVTDTRSDRYGVAPLVYAAGKGIELGVVYHVHLGHGHTACHGEVFHDVIHPWVLLSAE